jgi:uncharacterized DUF497 family protein
MLIRFEWDPAKAVANRRKHGFSFDIALRVFADPFALTDRTLIEGGEYRWQTLGTVEGHVILLVVHTTREYIDEAADTTVEVIRIISARLADRKERQRYEQENR